MKSTQGFPVNSLRVPLFGFDVLFLFFRGNHFVGVKQSTVKGMDKLRVLF